MILLYNCYLDDKPRIPGLYFRGNYGYNTDSIDIFKYTLSSVSNIYNWKKVIINVVLNPTLNNRKTELFDYIKLLFKNHELILNDFRCEYQKDWQKLYELFNDDLIYFCCNHDHVFIDSDCINFKKSIDEFRENFSETCASYYFSHWPEISVLFLNKKSHIGNGDVSDSSCKIKDTFAYTNSSNIDSVQIITKKTYYKWWFDKDFSEKFLPRTDYFGETIPTKFIQPTAIPYREYFKHFDGYTHIGTLLDDEMRRIKAANTSCPLFIPYGFFNNKIKLNIGFDENLKNYVNINLNKLNYTVIDKNGTDLKCFKDEIPYFWKDKIQTIHINSDYDEKQYLYKRNYSIINPLRCGLFHGTLNNIKIIEKIMNSYEFYK
jgi:hypothetical protein